MYKERQGERDRERTSSSFANFLCQLQTPHSMDPRASHQDSLVFPAALKPIDTKKPNFDEHRHLDDDDDDQASTSGVEEPLSPAGRLFHAPTFNCCIIAIIGSKTSINPSTIKNGLENTLLKHPRFSSKLVGEGRKQKWKRTIVNLDDHIIVPNLEVDNMDSPDQYVQEYIANLTTMPMDLSKPLWDMHLLNIKTSDAEAVCAFRIHHSIGDGASLMFLLLACTRKTSDPEALPSIPVQKRAGSNNAAGGGFWSLFLAIWMVLRLLWNTLVDMTMFVATMLFLKDTMNPLKAGSPGVEHKPKKIVHRSVSLDDIKLVKNAMNTTINDVVMGVTQAGLSRYLNRKYGENADNGRAAKQKKSNLPNNIRLRATVLVNLRPTAGIQDLADLMAKGPNAKWGWGNRIGYIILPLKIALQDDPLDYVRGAKSIIDRKKQSLESTCSYTCALIVLRTLGVKVSAAIAHKTVSSATLSFSNVVGPLEEITFCGHPIAYLAPTVYGHPQALTLHFQSYCNKMTIVVSVDPDVIPDPHRLCEDMEESLKLIKDAVVKLQSTQHTPSV